MSTTIEQLRIPKNILDLTLIKEHDEVELIPQRNAIIIQLIEPKKSSKFDNLMKLVKQMPPLPSQYDDPNYDPDYKILRDEAYKERGLLQ